MIYARATDGRYTRRRRTLVALSLLAFCGLPWLTWDGRQALRFDLDAPSLNLFALVLGPRAWAAPAVFLIGLAVALILIAARFGRLWCGYGCPQMASSMVFLGVERYLEGDRYKRMGRDSGPWRCSTIARKCVKHAVWVAIGAGLGLHFVGWFTPIRALWLQAWTCSASSAQTFWIAFFGGALYIKTAWLRERVCAALCPYATMQGAFTGPTTQVIAYDEARGEPRGARSRRADRADRAAQALGDCVGCTLCVQVCPAGIDIRKGLQNECTGCAACIDVCDSVMQRMGYPSGLIGYVRPSERAVRRTSAGGSRA